MTSTSTRAMQASVVVAFGVVVLAVAAATPARAMGNPRTAAIQVALSSRGLYGAAIDGFRGPATVQGIRTLQRRAGLTVDGIVGRATRRAMGRLGRPLYGTRTMTSGMIGWDVANLQFLLAWHGFPSGTIDGGFGPRTQSAVIRFQRYARLGADGVVGPATRAALRAPLPHAPFSLSRPSAAAVGDGFGPRGHRFHVGIDFTASYGARIRAARTGRVFFAGWDSGGFGYLVRVAHGSNLTTWYAHMSRIAVHRGQRVATGTVLGYVGATGFATGPHLHFEAHLRGAAFDPLPALR